MRDNSEFFATMKNLIDDWCARRALAPLARLLPAYLAFNGLADSWGDLLDALEGVRASCRDGLPETDLAIVGDLIRAAEKAIYP
jgi:hypothetical protein